MASPERTCVGCRRKRRQAELIRFKAEGGQVVPARPGTPGRSAYLCPDERCLEAAQRRRAFARAFRAPVALDAAAGQAAGDEHRCEDAAAARGRAGDSE